MAARLMAIAALLTLPTCSPPSPPAAPLQVRISGCAPLTHRVCFVDPKVALKLRVETQRPVRMSPDAGGPRRRDEGQLFVIEPGDARQLVLRAGEAEWGIELRPVQRWPALDALAKTKELDALRAAVAALPEALKGRGLGQLARLEFRKGAAKVAVGTALQAIERAGKEGRLSDEARDRSSLAYRMIQAGDFDEARRQLEGLERLAARVGTAWVALPYYAGMLARHGSDFRSALAHYAEAERRAASFEAPRRLSAAQAGRGLVYRSLGRHAEAAALFEHDLKTAKGCKRGAALNNLGLAWSHLPPSPERDVVPHLEEAHGLLQGCPPDANLPLVILARLALEQLEAEEAAALLARVSAETVTDAVDREARLLRGRLKLAQGRAGDALGSFEDLLGRVGSDVVLEWRARVGRARSLAALDRLDAALAAHSAAARSLDHALARIPVDAGRAGYLAQTHRATAHHLSLLLDAGRVEEAARTARNARSRAMRSLWRQDRVASLSPEARRAWEAGLAEYRRLRRQVETSLQGEWSAPADELAGLRAQRQRREVELRELLDSVMQVLRVPEATTPPAVKSGTALLTWHPLEGEAWVGFVLTAEGVRAHRYARRPSTGAETLAPLLRDLPATVRRLDVLPYGPLAALDLHETVIEGAPLLQRYALVYGMDLPPRPTAASGDTLVVTDPRQDLASARGRAEAIARQLGKRGAVRSLRGAQATAEAFRRALGTTRLLHFDGHGQFGGHEGWDTALHFAGGGRMTVSDVLALPASPAEVVLAGCETARASDEVGVQALGLAQAFLLSGAGSVVATTRTVDDALAAELGLALHAQRGRHPELDLAEALRRAQLDLARRRPASDWAAFRVLVR